MADILRRHRSRFRPRRLCRGDPRGAARPQDRDRRARVARRHLPQLGLHPDQGAAALGRDLPLHAARRRITGSSAEKISADLEAVVKRSPRRRQAAQPGRHAPDEEEQDRGAHGRPGVLTAPGKLTVTGEEGKKTELDRQAHHRRHRRARARPAVRPGRRQARLDLSPRDDAARNADQAAGDRIGRDRDRVRQLLQRHGRRGDGGRNARPHRAGGRCRRLGLPRKGARPSRA